MSKPKKLMGVLGLAAAGMAMGVLAAGWWSRRVAIAAPPLPHALVSEALDIDGDARARDDAFHDFPPDSTDFEPAPVSDRHITARPTAPASHWQSADDYDSIGSDELGSAFLARATDSLSEGPSDDEEESLDERAGFRIVQPD